MATIEGVEVEVSAEAVVVTAAAPLTVLSSAVAGGYRNTASSNPKCIVIGRRKTTNVI